MALLRRGDLSASPRSVSRSSGLSAAVAAFNRLSLPEPCFHLGQTPVSRKRRAVPHVPEVVQPDAFARFHRLQGDDTWFLTGTDDNSLKNVLAAERPGPLL